MEKPLFTPIDARRPATGDELLNYGVALSPAGRFMSDQEIGKFREDVNIVKGNSTSIAFYSAIAGVVICEAVNLMATHHPKWAVAAAIGATVPAVLAYSAKWFQTWYMDHTITHDPFRVEQSGTQYERKFDNLKIIGPTRVVTPASSNSPV